MSPCNRLVPPLLTATIWLPIANPYSAWKVPATIVYSLTPSIPRASPDSPATGLRPNMVWRIAPSNVKLLERDRSPVHAKGGALLVTLVFVRSTPG